MLKKYLPKILISIIITLLPIVFGVIMWDKLPEQVATHFNAAGEADGYGSKAMAVFALPLAMAALNLVCVLITMLDPKRRNIDGKAFSLIIWLVPAISLFTEGVIFATALDYKLNISAVMTGFIGIVFIVMGNYLPKCGQNYTLGIRTPWTLNDPDTWKATHRFGGRLFVVTGFLVIFSAFAKTIWVMFAIMMTCLVVITVYSYLYYIKHHKESEKPEEK